MFQVKTKLFHFQESTVKFLQERESQNKNSLILSAPGTGKSITLLKFLEKSPEKTLIICPSNLIYNWLNEICIHSNFTKSDVNIFHGSNRKLDDSLITITSYSIISNSVKNEQLFNEINQKFTRVVLDEAHLIRNKATITSLSILRLTIPKRIAMTATPIFNRVDDLYPLFKFLDLIHDEYDMKVLTGNLTSYKTLNKFIKEHSIRFTKEIVLTELKPKIITTIDIQFTTEEREFYDALLDYCQDRIHKTEEHLAKIKLRMSNSSLDKLMRGNLLVFILRLKQCVNNPTLILKSMKRLAECETLSSATKYLLSCKNNIDEECAICFDNLATNIAHPCGHAACSSCWKRLTKSGKIHCPHCRTEVEYTDTRNNILNEKPNEKSDFQFTQISSKVKKVTELINEIVNKGEKVVVVSQYIDTLENIKSNVDIKYVDITGKIPLVMRQENVNQFSKNDDIKICYLSLTAGSEGINLTSANHLILIDLYWNDAKLEQVFDRINRIGQHKQTYIYKINITDTIEYSINKMIDKKRNLSKMLLRNIDEKKAYEKELQVLEEKIHFI